jgi:hypothetical protein
MKKDRQLIAQAVLEGKLSANHLTQAEAEELRVNAELAIMQKLIDDRQIHGDAWTLWDPALGSGVYN